MNTDLYIIPEYKFSIPFPVCLSCPYFCEDLICQTYPFHFEEVMQLVNQYCIDEYNEVLDELSTQFELEKFEEEMHFL